jgi:hypothetical protein
MLLRKCIGDSEMHLLGCLSTETKDHKTGASILVNKVVKEQLHGVTIEVLEVARYTVSKVLCCVIIWKKVPFYHFRRPPV